MELNLKDKVAIVTGGSSGIGRVICKTFAREGAKVVVFARNEERGNKVRDECSALGVDSLFIKTDVTDQEMVVRGVNHVLHSEQFGKIDILVNNAVPYARQGEYIQPFLEQPPLIAKKFVDVVLHGAINCTRAVVGGMMERKNGRIIYIGSDAGRIGDGYQAVYAAAKSGLVGFMKSIAKGMGRYNILSNLVSPALTVTEENTPMLTRIYGWGTEEGQAKLTKAYPLRKLGTAEDVANMVVFLCSDPAGYVTGQVIGVDGGFCMPSP